MLPYYQELKLEDYKKKIAERNASISIERKKMIARVGEDKAMQISDRVLLADDLNFGY